MSVATQRRIDRVLGRVICALLSLFCRRVVPPPDRRRFRHILVILLSEMGSLVLTHSMFHHLKQRFPDASLHVLTFERNRPILEALQLIGRDRILTVHGERLWLLLLESIKTTWAMRRLHIDTTLDCELFSRVSSILAFLSGARVRAGFHPLTQEGLYRGRITNVPVQYNPQCHISTQFVTLAMALESFQLPPAKRPPESSPFRLPAVDVSSDELESFRDQLHKDFPGILDKRLVLLYPSGGLLPIRAWPLVHFIRVATELAARGYAVGVIGMEEDRPLGEEIVQACRSEACANLTGYTRTVRELMVLFHLASLLIANDGGPGHFAALTPLPAILLFGPETPILYGSLAPNAVNLFASYSCSPCLTAYNHRNSPCDGDNRCLKSIRPEEVLSKAHDILESDSSGKA